MKTVTFEDHGQDFLRWELDSAGEVIGCGPFQGWLWIGAKVLNKTIRRGSRLRILARGEPSELILNYPVLAVKEYAK
jgi:hypothetical protein